MPPGDPPPVEVPSAGTARERVGVFISYSHADAEFLTRLLVHLAPLREEGVPCWLDQDIRAGADWRQGIDTALATARVAVLLISSDFFASKFIGTDELPVIQAAAERGELTILCVLLKPSIFEKSKLYVHQAINPPNKLLCNLKRGPREEYWKRLADEIRIILAPQPSGGREARDGQRPPLPPDKPKIPLLRRIPMWVRVVGVVALLGIAGWAIWLRRTPVVLTPPVDYFAHRELEVPHVTFSDLVGCGKATGNVLVMNAECFARWPYLRNEELYRFETFLRVRFTGNEGPRLYLRLQKDGQFGYVFQILRASPTEVRVQGSLVTGGHTDSLSGSGDAVRFEKPLHNDEQMYIYATADGKVFTFHFQAPTSQSGCYPLTLIDRNSAPGFESGSAAIAGPVTGTVDLLEWRLSRPGGLRCK